MPSRTLSWWDKVTQLVRFLSVQEVKTPLSFTFKSAFYLVALWVIVLLWGKQTEDFNKWFLEFSAGVFVLLNLGVWVIAWFRPKNLVYGEAGHRAERRMDWGTEQILRTEEEIKTLRPVHDKTALPPPEKPK
jgi:hypothetical protein